LLGVPSATNLASDFQGFASKAEFVWADSPKSTPSAGTEAEQGGSLLRRRFAFIGQIPSSKKPSNMTHTERILEATSLDAMNAEIKRRTGLSELELARFSLYPSSYSKQEIGRISEMVRDFNASIFSAVVFDALEVMRKIDLSQWDTLPRFHNSGVKESEKGQFYTSGKGLFDGFSNLSTAGHYGGEISKAMVDLNNVLFEALESIGERTKGEVIDMLVSNYTYQGSVGMVLKEGIATITQAIDILIAKEVQSEPPKTLDAILDHIADSGVVAHMAAVAPFGVVAPVASDMRRRGGAGARIDEQGRVFPPEAFVSEVETEVNRREGVPGSWTETLRGCPVAGRGVIVGADGQPQITASTPLGALTKEYISILKVVMKIHAQRGSVPASR
jgi:hypothetical protein